MLSGKELVRRANMKRPDPVRDPKRYRQWYYARLVVGRREDARKNLEKVVGTVTRDAR